MRVVRQIVVHWQCYLLCIFNFSLSPLSLLCTASKSTVYKRHCKNKFLKNILVIFYTDVWNLKVSTLEFSNVLIPALALNSPDSYRAVSLEEDIQLPWEPASQENLGVPKAFDSMHSSQLQTLEFPGVQDFSVFSCYVHVSEIILVYFPLPIFKYVLFHLDLCAAFRGLSIILCELHYELRRKTMWTKICLVKSIIKVFRIPYNI